ncbi:MAG: hypothetical protein HBSAPP04_00560 [Ignavibacteriaceae bacterium]|nr:MAG: hypothetical protein HBSAPP04_00560 [Ignavibacteriaceae bacterium]
MLLNFQFIAVSYDTDSGHSLKNNSEILSPSRVRHPFVDTIDVNEKNPFTSSSLEGMMIDDMKSIVRNAQKYYKMPENMGGGGKSFEGYIISRHFATGSLGFGEYRTIKVLKKSVEILGESRYTTASNGKDVKIKMRFNSEKILLTILEYK